MKTGEPAIVSAPADTPPPQDETTQSIILPAMERIDPFLRFLTKATGKTSVPLKLLQQVLPKTNPDANAKQADGCGGNDAEKGNDEILLELTHRGVLNYEPNKQTVGFPLPPSPSNSKKKSSTAQTAADALLPKPPSKLMGKGLYGSFDSNSASKI